MRLLPVVIRVACIQTVMNMDFPHPRRTAAGLDRRCDFATLVAVATTRQTVNPTSRAMLFQQPDVRHSNNTLDERITYFANQRNRKVSPACGSFHPTNPASIAVEPTCEHPVYLAGSTNGKFEGVHRDLFNDGQLSRGIEI